MSPDGYRTSPGRRALVFLATALAMVGSCYGYDSIAPVAGLLSKELQLSDAQIGMLNAVYSLPSMFIALIGGVQVDRVGARTVILWSSSISLVGATLTALGTPFALMVVGRLLFGLGAETMMVATLVALAQWFADRSFALVLALNVSAARLGSYLADRSPSFASTLYEAGWQPPLWLAAGAAALTLCGAILYFLVDKDAYASGAQAGTPPPERIQWHTLVHFPAEYWYIVGLCVTFYSVVLPFRSTFAIKYFQDVHGLTLQDASRMNSYVFMAAILAMPLFGALSDRLGRPVTLMVIGTVPLPLCFLLLGLGSANLWIPTVLLGVSFSLVPAVLWPAVAQYVQPNHRGTAYGLMGMLQSSGLVLTNVVVGHLNDIGGASAAHPQGYTPMVSLFGGIALGGLLFAALLNRRVPRRVGN